MTPEVSAFLRYLSDDELRAHMSEASAECAAAALTERDSERHQACFAAAVLFAQEANRRGIRLQ